MEIPTPSLESIGKFFGGLLVSIAAGWAFLKRIGLLEKKEEEEESVDKRESITQYLRRSEDAGLRIAVEKMEERIDRIEERVEKRFSDERTFFLGQIQNTENRLAAGQADIGRRLDAHYENINGRLDELLKK